MDTPAGNFHPYPVKDIPTDHAKAQRVFASFGRKLGPETEYLVSRDFLSGREDKELLLIRFLHLAFALGPGTVKRTGPRTWPRCMR